MSDFCYSGPMLKRVLDQADLMDRVMEAVGVVAAHAARLNRGMAWYEARCRCIACPDDRKCRAWLAGADARQTSRPPAFCRNTEFFRLAAGFPFDRGGCPHETGSTFHSEVFDAHVGLCYVFSVMFLALNFKC